MRLEWKEIRTRAKNFVREFQDATNERAETQTFYNAFFEIFGVDRKKVAVYERSVERLGGNKGFVDLFWPGTLLVEQKSAGRDMFAAEGQALDYTHNLRDSEMPRYILVCDFQRWKLTDLTLNETTEFTLSELPKHIEKFGFILGRQRVRFKDQDPVNIKAAELVGHLHDALEASGYTGHDLEQFLVRIVFCLFADDTGVFEPKDMLWDYLENHAAPDGSETGRRLAELFQVLDTPEDKRSAHLDPALSKFPYVNGDLFSTPIRIPSFDEDMHAALLNACRFDWTPISPAIFGSLFQSVMDPVERRKKGAHYTTEKNIMKVIEPLFLDDLRVELKHLKTLRTGRSKRLRAFQDKLGQLTFFDPACGCGNFLIIAYRELRELELEIMRELRDMGELPLLASEINVDQFYGIEYEEFPARIAETALWMMDHLMNRRLSDEFGEVYVRIPLRKSPHIHHADALELPWEQVLEPSKCSYILGNPPFIGAKYQSSEQRQQVREIADLGKTGGTLDYVCAWFIKAGLYAADQCRIGFVSTNSITQGEQVAQLWPILFDRCGLEIAFAHRTFEWGSEARGKAHVHVVILGLCKRDAAPSERRLYSYADIKGEPEESRFRALSPYLFGIDPDLQRVAIKETSRPINGMPRIVTGTQPIDGGNLIFTEDEKQEFLVFEPSAIEFFRPFMSGKDFLDNKSRHILALQDASPNSLRQLPKVRERLRLVSEFRSKSTRKSTLAIANTPTVFNVSCIPDADYLALPEVSSENRDYIPIGWLGSNTIPSNKLRALLDAELWHFGILTSQMHMAWMRAITGRMKSDYMYSVGVVYNTFPLPPGKDLSKLEPLAQDVLDAREAHPDATLADLYDPDLMPANLRRAHQALDRAVDKLYRRSGFASDRERVEHLFALYEKMTAPMLAKGPKRKRRKG